MTTRTTSYPRSDYAAALKTMVETCGLDEETQTSTEDLSGAIDLPTSTVGLLRSFAERIGGLQIRYAARYTPDHAHLAGRSSYWRFIHTAEWMIEKAKTEWGIERFDHKTISTKMPLANGRKSPTPAAAEPLPPLSEENQFQQELRKVRKNDVEGLIEAVRQYNGREAFIQEELARFHAMGIEIDPTAIRFERNEAMEMAAPLVEHIGVLKESLDRQADLIGTLRGRLPSNDPAVKELRAEIERLKHERHQRELATEGLIESWRLKNQALDRRAKELEVELQKLATNRLRSMASA